MGADVEHDSYQVFYFGLQGFWRGQSAHVFCVEYACFVRVMLRLVVCRRQLI